MIPTMAPRTSRILPLYLLVLGAAVSGLSGCVADRETTLSRVARAREIQGSRANRERLAQELEVLTHQTGELGHEITVARARSVKMAATLRATLAGLNHELSKLVAAENDLAAAKKRAAAIENELKPLRDLEKTLREQDSLRQAAQQRVKLLQQAVQEAEADAKKVTTELQPKLDALRAQLVQAQQVEKAITDARAAVQAAAKVLAPTPPPNPKK